MDAAADLHRNGRLVDSTRSRSHFPGDGTQLHRYARAAVRRDQPPSIARTPRPRMPDGQQHRPDSASPSSPTWFGAAAEALLALPVGPAIDLYADERRSQVSARMVSWWKEMGRPLAAFFGDKPLRKISPGDLTAYQNARRDRGKAPKTVNSELSVLRQVLKHAKLWCRFGEDYNALKNTKPPAGPGPHRRRSGAVLFICEVQSGLVLRLRGGDAGLVLRPARV